ncbi:hypothetical protein, partial [Pseudovibrio sp. POLY-S9]|uniref:hypothetical protein n=1 Tax=Pseudovibrio sp. POLY-S9 TaxID=1576596 RepID=UPI00070C847A
EDIKEAGTAATITRYVGGGGPTGGDVTKLTASTFVLETQFSSNEIDGTRVKATDVKLLMPALNLGLVPTADDKINYVGQTLSIINPKRIAPDGEPIFYELQARR